MLVPSVEWVTMPTIITLEGYICYNLAIQMGLNSSNQCRTVAWDEAAECKRPVP